MKIYSIFIQPLRYSTPWPELNRRLPPPDTISYYATLGDDEAQLVRDLLSLKVKHNKIDSYAVEVFAPISYPELMKYIDEVGE